VPVDEAFGKYIVPVPTVSMLSIILGVCRLYLTVLLDIYDVLNTKSSILNITPFALIFSGVFTVIFGFNV
jgi:hypothetical protein